MSTQSFIAQPHQTFKVGDAICRSKRRCDVVFRVWPKNLTFIMGPDACLNVNLPPRPYGDRVEIRPMTWWESLKHELFGDCQCQ